MYQSASQVQILSWRVTEEMFVCECLLCMPVNI